MQNEHIERVMKDHPQSIKDLALLSFASRQGHPKIFEWYETKIVKLKFPELKLCVIPEFKLCVTHIKDCHYIGQWQYTLVSPVTMKPLVQLLADEKRREQVCKQCLNQVCRVLCHLKEKNICYVHGELTVDNIVMFNRKYYIMDKGFSKQQYTNDPYLCYRLPTHDLYTLCSSMRDYFDTDSYFDLVLSGLPGDDKFLPEMFQV